MSFLVALFGVQPVIGREHQDGVPAQSKRFGDRLAPQIIRAGVVRRVEIRQDKDFHRPRLAAASAAAVFLDRIGSFTRIRPDLVTSAMTPWRRFSIKARNPLQTASIFWQGLRASSRSRTAEPISVC